MYAGLASRVDARPSDLASNCSLLDDQQFRIATRDLALTASTTNGYSPEAISSPMRRMPLVDCVGEAASMASVDSAMLHSIDRGAVTES